MLNPLQEKNRSDQNAKESCSDKEGKSACLRYKEAVWFVTFIILQGS